MLILSLQESLIVTIISETMQSPNEFTPFYQNCMREDAIAYGAGGMSNSYPSSHQLSPSKDYASKPIKRRSRVSKKTPITLLNTNTNNFRALVQQFTGCPSSTSLSFLGNKGPVNLNFEQQGYEQNHQHANSAITAMAPLAYNYNHDQQSQMIFKQQEKHNQLLQGQFQEVYHGQQSAYSFDSVGRYAVHSTSSVEFPENLSAENMNLCEFIDDSLLYDNRGL